MEPRRDRRARFADTVAFNDLRRQAASEAGAAAEIAATKEPAIAPGTAAQYWRGDKTWQDLAAAIDARIAAVAATSVVKVAGEDLGGHRAAYVAGDGKVHYAQPDGVTGPMVCGITQGAAATGADVTIQTDGPITEPSWAWTAGGPIYLGTDGALTQSVPTSGAIVQLGVPAGPTTLVVEPIFIAKL